MIRKATEKDMEQVEQIYNEVIDHEARTVSYTNWQKGLYPTLEYAKGSLEKGTLFVGEEACSLYGCVVLNQIQPQEYRNIPWTIPAVPEEVMVIHTLCIRPSFSGKGKGSKFVLFSENYARDMHWPVIRLDTYEGNLPACGLYPKLGYTFAGITRFHFQNVIWENLRCFEKRIV